MVVRARDRDDLGARNISDGPGRDDRSLALHQAGDGGDGAQRAGIGELHRPAGEDVGQQAVGARPLAANETLAEKDRANRQLHDDLAGGTMQLTNPGTLGTVASVPRLMKGQGSIIATGTIRDVAGTKIITITSTYDHRIIQGAESGMFLRTLDSLLQGEEQFYEQVTESLTGGEG